MLCNLKKNPIWHLLNANSTYESSKSVSEYHVTWVWRRCGASRLTGVLSSTKIPNDSSS